MCHDFLDFFHVKNSKAHGRDSDGEIRRRKRAFLVNLNN
jgi:hypothetical protein